MKALAASILPIIAGAAVLGLVPAALAHGDNHGHGGMEMSDADKPLPEEQYPPTYFALPDHRAAIYGHVGLMVLGWVFVLPAGKAFPGECPRYSAIGGPPAN